MLVVDYTLISFVGWMRSENRDLPSVVYDSQIESYLALPPPPGSSVALFAEGHDRLIESDADRRRFSCSIPNLRALERDRFLDVDVAIHPILRGWVDGGRPYVAIDGG